MNSIVGLNSLVWRHAGGEDGVYVYKIALQRQQGEQVERQKLPTYLVLISGFVYLCGPAVKGTIGRIVPVKS